MIGVFRLLLSPRLIGLHLLAVVAVTAAVWLGLWQYDAWDAHRDAQAMDLAGATPEPLSDVMTADDPFPGDAVGQPVELEGLWLADETFFVANRDHQGTSGYWVVTPVAVCDSTCEEGNPAMLVVRGWTEEARDASAPPQGTATIDGWLQPAEGSGRQDPDPTDDVLPELRIASVLQRMDQDLYCAYVISETSGTAQQLVPVTPDSLPAPTTFTAWRNLLYALEWWVFGAFAGFVWWRWCRDEIAESAEVASSP